MFCTFTYIGLLTQPLKLHSLVDMARPCGAFQSILKGPCFSFLQQRSVDGKHLMSIQRGLSVFIIVVCSVETKTKFSTNLMN